MTAPAVSPVQEVSNDDIHTTVTHTLSDYFMEVTTIPTTNVVETLTAPIPTGNYEEESTTPELTTTFTRTRIGYVTMTLRLVDSEGTSSTSTNDAVAASALTRFLHDGFAPADASTVLVPEITSIYSNPTLPSPVATEFQAIPESDDNTVVVVETRLVYPMESLWTEVDSMETTSTYVLLDTSNLPLAGVQPATRFIYHPSLPLTGSFMSSTEVESATTVRATNYVTDSLTTTLVLPGYSYTSSFQSHGTAVPSSYSYSTNSALENTGAATSGLDSTGTFTSSATTHAASADFSPSTPPHNSSLVFPGPTSVVNPTSELDLYTSYTLTTLSTLVAHPGFTSLPSSDDVVSTADIDPLLPSASTSASQQIPGTNFSHTTTELSSSSAAPDMKSYTLFSE